MTARVQWTDEKVEMWLRRAIEVLGLARMPTASQLRELPQGNSLVCALTRRGGFDSWADRLGVPHSEHDSRKGWRWEQWVAELVRLQGLDVVERSAVKTAWDLQISGRDVDVKVAQANTHGNALQWTWRINAVEGHRVDLYVLVGVEVGQPPFVLICPAEEIPQSCATVRGDATSAIRGKHSRWLGRWDLLR